MQIAKLTVKGNFTYGSILDTSAVFVRVLQAPEVREMINIGQKVDHRSKYWEAVKSIIDNIANYLTVILETKGPRTTLGQRAYRTVLAACSGKNLVDGRHQEQAARILVRYSILLLLLLYFGYLIIFLISYVCVCARVGVRVSACVVCVSGAYGA